MKHHQLNLRKATIDDAQIIFDLSNDPTVRSQSFNKEPLVWGHHVKWLSSKISDPQYIYLLFFDHSGFVGQVRFDGVSETEVAVSISINQIARGKGYASIMYGMAVDYLFEHRPDVEASQCFISIRNIPSHKAALKSGFRYIEDRIVNDEPYHFYIINRQIKYLTQNN